MSFLNSIVGVLSERLDQRLQDIVARQPIAELSAAAAKPGRFETHEVFLPIHSAPKPACARIYPLGELGTEVGIARDDVLMVII